MLKAIASIVAVLVFAGTAAATVRGVVWTKSYAGVLCGGKAKQVTCVQLGNGRFSVAITRHAVAVLDGNSAVFVRRDP
jgi:hypothetical protein